MKRSKGKKKGGPKKPAEAGEILDEAKKRRFKRKLHEVTEKLHGLGYHVSLGLSLEVNKAFTISVDTPYSLERDSAALIKICVDELTAANVALVQRFATSRKRDLVFRPGLEGPHGFQIRGGRPILPPPPGGAILLNLLIRKMKDVKSEVGQESSRPGQEPVRTDEKSEYQSENE